MSILINCSTFFVIFSRPSRDVLGGYRSRVTFLRRVLTELTPPSDPVPRLGLDVPELGLGKGEEVLLGDGQSCRERRRKKQQELHGEIDPASSSSTALPKVKPFRPLPRAIGQDEVKGKQIHQRRDQRHQLDQREQHFGRTDEGEIEAFF